MKNFETIKVTCGENNKISRVVIDEFLIYYAANRNNLERDMNKRFASFTHVTRKFQKEWVNMLKSQYIAHKIFMKDGLIRKYLNHSALRQLDRKGRNFLEQQSKQPWKFSFSVISDRPAEDFFTMEDVFSGDEYLLYSPGVSNTLLEQPVSLWFNLLGYNGKCWQSFGPIGAYKSFEDDDIYFFATELNNAIEDDEGILADVDRNPLPYMMLLSGANYPVTFHKEDSIVQVMAECDLDTMNTKELTESFITEYNGGVYRLILKNWGDPPHFSQAYFDESLKLLILSAKTDPGFQALVTGINEYGYNFSYEPTIRVHPSMIITAQDILKKKIVLSEYEAMFTKKTSKEEEEKLDKLNTLMRLAMPDINAGRKPDIKALAQKAGLDIKTAREVLRQITGKFNDMNQR